MPQSCVRKDAHKIDSELSGGQRKKRNILLIENVLNPHAFARDVHCKSLFVVIRAGGKRFVAGILPAVRRGQDDKRAKESGEHKK